MKKSNQEILGEIKKFAGEERKYRGLVLEHLEVVRERKLYAELKYKSLLEYAIKELGYSESSAARRIRALRVVQAHPEVKERLMSGEISLGVIDEIQSLSRMNKLEKQDTQVLIDLSLGKSQAEFREEVKLKFDGRCEKPFLLPPRYLKILATDGLEKKFEVVHGMLMSRGCRKREEVLAYLLDMALEKLQGGRERKKCREASPERQLKSVTPKMKREVMQRDGHQCRRCGSRFQLEVDHRLARARGGKNVLSNLELLCRSCNHWKGARVIGGHK